MNNLKEKAFYEITSNGLVVRLIKINGTIATCSYQGQSRTFILDAKNLKYLGDSYKPLIPKSIDLYQLIKERNQEIFDFNQSKVKTKKKDAQLELAKLILLTPAEDLQELLISRGLNVNPETVEDTDAQ